MKKILWGIALCAVALQSCKKDDDEVEAEVQLTIAEQNDYDDQAAVRFLDTHYFNEKGVVTEFDSEDTSDDNQKKLSDYKPVKLPSGVIYIVRPDAQPTDGKTIEASDSLNIMQHSKSYVAKKVDGIIKFSSEQNFSNTISGNGGMPIVDPFYYYVTDEYLSKYNKDNSTSYDKYFFEIKGLREGLQNFKAFNLDNSADYNLQGIIIVPSREAYARNKNIYSYVDKSFVFNFQIYKAITRPKPTK